MIDTTKIEALEAEIDALRRRLGEAKDELLQERFADHPPKYKVGDVVLVPRKLFGQRKLWPAKISAVHLDYSSGIWTGRGTGSHQEAGEPWENWSISYSYYLQAKDGSFSGVSNGASEHDIEGYAP